MVLRQGRPFICGPTPSVLSDARWPDSCVELPLCVRIGAPQRSAAPSPQHGSNPCRRPLSAMEWDQELFAARQTNATGAVTLKTENLSYVLGHLTIVNGVDITLHAGQCAAIVGANGAGKTTLLRLINGLLRPSGGAYPDQRARHHNAAGLANGPCGGHGLSKSRQPVFQADRGRGTDRGAQGFEVL